MLAVLWPLIVGIGTECGSNLAKLYHPQESANSLDFQIELLSLLVVLSRIVWPRPENGGSLISVDNDYLYQRAAGRLQVSIRSQFLPRRAEQNLIDVHVLGLSDRVYDCARK